MSQYNLRNIQQFDNSHLLKRCFAYFKPHKWKVIIGMLAATIVSGTNAATAYLVKSAMDNVFVQKDTTALALVPLAFFFGIIIKSIFRFAKALEQRKSVFLMPSDYEGLPLAHVEALFCGLPAVISRHVPSREIAADASLVCETTANDIADKLTVLLRDSALYNRLAQAALAIAPNYSMECYAGNLLVIYEKIQRKRQR